MTRHPAPFVRMTREIEDALVRGRPVVALETTLVAHGFPPPIGVQTALASEEDEASAIHRYFTREGKPSQEIEIRAGARCRELRYDALGRPSEERHVDPQGRLHGPSVRWFPDPDASPYLDPRVRE